MKSELQNVGYSNVSGVQMVRIQIHTVGQKRTQQRVMSKLFKIAANLSRCHVCFIFNVHVAVVVDGHLGFEVVQLAHIVTVCSISAVQTVTVGANLSQG